MREKCATARRFPPQAVKLFGFHREKDETILARKVLGERRCDLIRS